MHVCLIVVSRTGFGRYLFALKFKVIILTDGVDRGWVGRGRGWVGWGGGRLIEGCRNKFQRCTF